MAKFTNIVKTEIFLAAHHFLNDLFIYCANTLFLNWKSTKFAFFTTNCQNVLSLRIFFKCAILMHKYVIISLKISKIWGYLSGSNPYMWLQKSEISWKIPFLVCWLIEYCNVTVFWLHLKKLRTFPLTLYLHSVHGKITPSLPRVFFEWAIFFSKMHYYFSKNRQNLQGIVEFKTFLIWIIFFKYMVFCFVF